MWCENCKLVWNVVCLQSVAWRASNLLLHHSLIAHAYVIVMCMVCVCVCVCVCPTMHPFLLSTLFPPMVPWPLPIYCEYWFHLLIHSQNIHATVCVCVCVCVCVAMMVGALPYYHIRWIPTSSTYSFSFINYCVSSVVLECVMQHSAWCSFAEFVPLWFLSQRVCMWCVCVCVCAHVMYVCE